MRIFLPFLLGISLLSTLSFAATKDELPEGDDNKILNSSSLSFQAEKLDSIKDFKFSDDCFQWKSELHTYYEKQGFSPSVTDALKTLGGPEMGTLTEKVREEMLKTKENREKRVVQFIEKLHSMQKDGESEESMIQDIEALKQRHQEKYMPNFLKNINQ